MRSVIALQVIVEFLADKLRQVATRSFDFLNKARVVLGDNGMERRLFRPVAVVGRSGGNRGWSGHWVRCWSNETHQLASASVMSAVTIECSKTAAQY
jgi:hypothetical protein